MTSSNQSDKNQQLEQMLSRYNVGPHDKATTPDPAPKPVPEPAPEELLDHDQPVSLREAKGRQNIQQHGRMKDQSIWNRVKPYILPAGLVICIVLSFFTSVF